MGNDVIFNKISVIERCMERVQEEYGNDPSNLKNYTKQDSIVLNIQRACESSIDLAMHIVARHKLGLPQTSREAFDLLYSNKVIDNETVIRLKAMVGFRNIALRDYQNINTEILQKIVEVHLNDFGEFTNQILHFK